MVAFNPDGPLRAEIEKADGLGKTIVEGLVGQSVVASILSVATAGAALMGSVTRDSKTFREASIDETYALHEAIRDLMANFLEDHKV